VNYQLSDFLFPISDDGPNDYTCVPASFNAVGHWLCVGNTSDSSYLNIPGVPAREEYLVSVSSLSVNTLGPTGITVNWTARAGGITMMEPGVRWKGKAGFWHGGTTYLGPERSYGTNVSTPVFFSEVWSLNPATDDRWLKTDIATFVLKYKQTEAPFALPVGQLISLYLACDTS